MSIFANLLGHIVAEVERFYEESNDDTPVNIVDEGKNPFLDEAPLKRSCTDLSHYTKEVLKESIPKRQQSEEIRTTRLPSSLLQQITIRREITPPKEIIQPKKEERAPPKKEFVDRELISPKSSGSVNFLNYTNIDGEEEGYNDNEWGHGNKNHPIPITEKYNLVSQEIQFVKGSIYNEIERGIVSDDEMIGYLEEWTCSRMVRQCRLYDDDMNRYSTYHQYKDHFLHYESFGGCSADSR